MGALVAVEEPFVLVARIFTAVGFAVAFLGARTLANTLLVAVFNNTPPSSSISQTLERDFE